LKKETCEIELAGDASKLQVELVAKDGSPLAHALLQKIEGEHYTARCPAPDVPFRVSITGVDANGAAFRRVERGLRQ